MAGSLRQRARRVDRRVFARSFDPAQRWLGNVAPGEAPSLRVLRYGDCEFREMAACHSIATEVGYPRDVAERLQAEGISMEFFNRFVSSPATLPQTAEELRRHVKLTGPPDVVLVQVGGIHGYRTILGVGSRRMTMRDRIGQRLGEGVHFAYRLANPIIRRLGRVDFRYPGADGLDGFVRTVREEWPAARILVMGLVPVHVDGAFDPAITRTVSREILERAAGLGVPTLDLEDVLPAHLGGHGPSGLNLNAVGGGIVADVLVRWLREAGVVGRSGAAAEAPQADLSR